MSGVTSCTCIYLPSINLLEFEIFQEEEKGPRIFYVDNAEMLSIFKGRRYLDKLLLKSVR